MSAPLELLKFNIQEREYPYFEDSELEMLLISNDNNVNKASWKGCLLKAATDDEIKVGPVETKSTNSSYWLNLAETYKAEYEKEESKNKSNTGYKTSMQRVDGR
ncbi:hypothetical protein 10S11_22 [uncultured Caudovirales phage]|uniref:Uncharacterized protein n=1 Tax=uncultured Caudovirales phage TaxID=2100421 RepID=A0A2H4J040_9CAUD|nr:hypothetical protein 10S11_22 [uncultured Caudovirales phage]